MSSGRRIVLIGFPVSAPYRLDINMRGCSSIQSDHLVETVTWPRPFIRRAHGPTPPKRSGCGDGRLSCGSGTGSCCWHARNSTDGFSAGSIPEDVVLSVYRSFFTRHRDGRCEVTTWDELWSMLTIITARKCINRAEYHLAKRRTAAAEVDGDGETTLPTVWNRSLAASPPHSTRRSSRRPSRG